MWSGTGSFLKINEDLKKNFKKTYNPNCSNGDILIMNMYTIMIIYVS